MKPLNHSSQKVQMRKTILADNINITIVVIYSYEVIRWDLKEKDKCDFTFPIIKGFLQDIRKENKSLKRFKKPLLNPKERPKDQTNQYGQCCTTFVGIFLILVSVWGFGGYEYYHGPDELWTQSTIILGIGLRIGLL